MTWLLLRTWMRSRWRAQFRNKGTGVAVLVMRASAFVFGFMFVQFVVRLAGTSEGLLPGLMPATSVLMVLSGVTIVIQHLFLDEEMDFLRAAPASDGTLFAYNVLRTGAGTASGMGLLQIAVLLGYGLAAHAGVLYYVGAFVVTAILIALTASMSMPLVLVITRFVPAARLKGVIALLGPMQALLYFGLTQAFTRPGSGRAVRDIGEAFRRKPGLAALPTTWAAQALDGIRTGRADVALVNAAALLALAALFLIGGRWLFVRTFAEGRTRIAYVPGRRRRVAGWPTGPRALRAMPGAMRAMVVKDWRSMRRDLRWLTGMIMPLAMIVFFGLQSVRNPSQQGGMAGMVVMVPLFLGMTASQAFVIEGQGLAILRGAPVRSVDVLRAKLVSGALPAVVIAWLLAAGLSALKNLPVVGVLAIATWMVAMVCTVHVSVAARSIQPGTAAPQYGRQGCMGGLLIVVLDAIVAGPPVLLGVWLFARTSLPAPARHAAVGIVLAVFSMAALGIARVLWRRGIAALDAWEP